MEKWDEFRELLREEINLSPAPDRAEAELRHGKVWDTEELKRDFEVHAFAAPFVLVTRKADGVKGALTFQHLPRFYFEFVKTEDVEN